MSFMDRLPRPKAMTNYGPLDDRSYYPGGNYYGGDFLSAAGMPVSSDTAMRLITVQNCVRVRVATISQIPCHVMERDGKIRNKAEDFYLYSKLHDQPNSWQTASEFWGMVEAHICLHGQMLCYKLGLDDRPVLEIIPIQPDRVIKISQNTDYSLTYQIRLGNGETKEFPQSKIVHFRGLTLDGINGVNPIEYARETIGLGSASSKFLSNYFDKGLHPGALIETEKMLSLEARKNLGTALREEYGGLTKSQGLMLLDDGMKIQFPTIKLVDAQYLEQMKMGEAQICGLFRVPLMLIQSGDKTPTYASAEQFFLNYSVIGVTPDCKNYEGVIWRDLLTPNERKRYYAKFAVDALLRGDFKTRMDGYQIGINCEMLSPNDCREKEDMNPYDGGDEYRSRTSTIKESDKVPDKSSDSEDGNDSSNGGK
jgi:HK97 family phage portal protein